MGLSNCEHCGSIEGGFREPTEKELMVLQALHGIYITADELMDLVCLQCGESGGYHGIPEGELNEER